MIRRSAVIAVLVAVAACGGGGDDDSGLPSRDGMQANRWADASKADLDCGREISFCGVNVAARDDESIATVDGNYNLTYDPAGDDVDGTGWSRILDIAAEINCPVPAARSVEPWSERCE